jgi:hypothetical protein
MRYPSAAGFLLLTGFAETHWATSIGSGACLVSHWRIYELIGIRLGKSDQARRTGAARLVAEDGALVAGAIMPRPRLGATIEQAGKTRRHGACDDLAHQLTQAHFAELRLEGQRCDDFIRKVQRDGPLATAEVHHHREICAVPLLPLDVVWRRCCSLVLLRALDFINLFKSEVH